ncbi:MAG: NAD(P)-dependent oxidoreductase [Microthrixaceae bacterium]
MERSRRVAVGPEGVPGWLGEAVAAGGGEVVDLTSADALLWGAPNDPEALRRVLDAAGDRLQWVQLPWAGIEPYVEALDTDRLWSCGKGVYAEPVAEMALTLGLAAMRAVDRYARATTWLQHGHMGVNLRHAHVTLLGGGGITESLLRLLVPFEADVTVVRNRPTDMAGATRVVGSTDAEIDEAIGSADLVVLALALTPETDGIIDRRRLRLMHERSVLVNVARGAHIVTDDLVEALRGKWIMGAGLDVTDPEPLPDDHPLWSLENCIITPHVGNTPEMARPLLAERITTNMARWIAGVEVIGRVDPALGY